MKKNLKIKLLFGLLAAGSLFTQNTKAYPAPHYATCVCTTYNGDGSTTQHSACEEPDSNGPCDRIQNC